MLASQSFFGTPVLNPFGSGSLPPPPGQRLPHDLRVVRRCGPRPNVRRGRVHVRAAQRRLHRVERRCHEAGAAPLLANFWLLCYKSLALRRHLKKLAGSTWAGSKMKPTQPGGGGTKL